MPYLRPMSLASAFGIFASPLQAQTVELIELKTPVVAFAEPFSRIVGVRELSDRTILVADRLEQALPIIDLKRGTMDEVGAVDGHGLLIAFPAQTFYLSHTTARTHSLKRRR